MKNLQESSMWHYILDENKNVIPTKNYKLIGDFYESNKKIIRKTYIKDIEISTVFLTIDHDYNFDILLSNWNGGKPNPMPVVFETMIFCDEESLDGYQDRYRTYKDALAGHREAVRLVIKHIRDKYKVMHQ